MLFGHTGFLVLNGSWKIASGKLCMGRGCFKPCVILRRENPFNASSIVLHRRDYLLNIEYGFARTSQLSVDHLQKRGKPNCADIRKVWPSYICVIRVSLSCFFVLNRIESAKFRVRNFGSQIQFLVCTGKWKYSEMGSDISCLFQGLAIWLGNSESHNAAEVKRQFELKEYNEPRRCV
jgi:hypothetical protein